jgi:FAD/FMN-containing dehydrogenase
MTIDLDALRTRVGGRVVAPADDDYDDIRAVFYDPGDLRPAAIACVQDPKDVASVVTFASETGAELAIRSGGHSGAGHSTSDGGIVIDLRELTAFDVDVESRTVWAGAGLTAAAYTAAAHEHGLATGFGDTGSVGIGGITNGGGIGYLTRKLGMTIDSLLAAEIVTADGEIRIVDEDHEPDLFWAIRGGGGNLGVVTRFRFALQGVGEVYGGMLFLPATPEVIVGFMEAAEAAPEELSTIANVMSAPPMPFIPEEAHGTPIVMGMMTYAGDVAEGERVVEGFRTLATPLADMVAAIPYPQMYPPEDPDYHPVAASWTGFMDHVGLAEATTMLERIEASDASLRAVQLRALGGAMARVPNDATAFAHRDRNIMLNVAAFIDEPSQRAEREAWVLDLARRLRQGPPAAYVNFLGADGADRIREAYPGQTWERLARIKATYDPTNLFHRNQNIVPEAETA